MRSCDPPSPLRQRGQRQRRVAVRSSDPPLPAGAFQEEDSHEESSPPLSVQTKGAAQEENSHEVSFSGPQPSSTHLSFGQPLSIPDWVNPQSYRQNFREDMSRQESLRKSATHRGLANLKQRGYPELHRSPDALGCKYEDASQLCTNEHSSRVQWLGNRLKSHGANQGHPEVGAAQPASSPRAIVLDQDLPKNVSPKGEPAYGSRTIVLDEDLPKAPQPRAGSAVLSMLLKDATVPKFTGKTQDFWDWHVELCQYIRLLSSGGELPEAVKLEVLRRSLDEVNASILQAVRERGTTFDQFMHTLDARYRELAQMFERQKWEYLECPDPSVCARDDFRLFRAKFVQGRNRVAIETLDQGYRLLMGKLPKEWRIKVMEEERERNEG